MPKQPEGLDADSGALASAKAEQIARRRLLRLGLYAAPAVLGTLLIGRDAVAQASCGPASCRPVTTGCGPSSCRPRP